MKNHSNEIVALNEIWSEASRIRLLSLAKYKVVKAMAATSLMNFISLGQRKGENLANSPEGLPGSYYSDLVANAKSKLNDLEAIV